MNLFFETNGQAASFLCMAPIGFAAAVCLDISAAAGRLRPVMDVLILLWIGLVTLGGVSLLQENALRAYHLLGLLTGGILYTEGIGKLIRIVLSWLKRKRLG